MKNLIFACYMGSAEKEKDALRLARSIRIFGGEFCFNPIWLLSYNTEDELSDATRQVLNSLGARLISFEMNEAGKQFPFATYVTAAGIAESLAQGEASYLAMMAADTLILQPPQIFLLPIGKTFGACPVHLKLLGSGFNEPVDEFWQLIYRSCKVEETNVFEIQTVVDEQSVRAYFNAGLLVVRPERGILRKWQSDFVALYQQPEFETFYKQSELYSIFMHQAILAGSILASTRVDEFQPFPFEVNYPLHLSSKMETSKIPESLDDLITCRYEDFREVFADPALENEIRIDQFLKNWIMSELEP